MQKTKENSAGATYSYGSTLEVSTKVIGAMNGDDAAAVWIVQMMQVEMAIEIRTLTRQS